MLQIYRCLASAQASHFAKPHVMIKFNRRVYQSFCPLKKRTLHTLNKSNLIKASGIKHKGSCMSNTIRTGRCCHRKKNVLRWDGVELCSFSTRAGVKVTSKLSQTVKTAASLPLCSTGSSPNHTDQGPAKATHSTPFNLDSCTSYSAQTGLSSKSPTHSPTFFIQARRAIG